MLFYLAANFQCPFSFIFSLDCFFRLNELHFALSDYQQALEMDNSDWSVRCRLSIVYNEFGILEYYDRHYLEAIDHLTTCIRYNPRIGAYYLSRARARYMIEVWYKMKFLNFMMYEKKSAM